LSHTFLVVITVGLGHGVYRKLYTLIGGQRAEKFESHWSKAWWRFYLYSDYYTNKLRKCYTKKLRKRPSYFRNVSDE